MGAKSFSGGFFKASEWITRLAYLNLLWIGFTVIGLVVFGILPSTIAMFSIARKWVRGETNIPIFHTFATTFKQEFWQSIKLGLFFFSIFVVLYLDYQALQFNSSFLYGLLSIAFLSMLFFLLCITLYIFPIYVHYEAGVMRKIKFSLIYAIVSPLSTIYMLIGCGLIWIVTTSVNGLVFFFGGSSFALLLMYIANNTFKRNDQRLQHGTEEEMENKSINTKTADNPENPKISQFN